MLTTTTCGRAQKLMPLYAAGDLAGRRGRRVAAHVGSCESCRRLAAEFAETREWTRAAAEPPEFEAAFYEHLRASVLDEIGRDRRPAGPLRAPFFDALSGRRFAYAASFALALVACALAFNFYSRRAADATQSPLATAQPDAREVAAPAPRHASPAHAAQASAAREEERRRSRPKLQRAAAGSNPRKTLSLPRRVVRGPEARELAVASSPETAPRRQAAPAGAEPTKPGEIARIEMQTADPNIRIIWLAPQEPDAPAPKR